MSKTFKATTDQRQDQVGLPGPLDEARPLSPLGDVSSGRRCSVCAHEHRQRIEELVRGKSSIRAVAKQFKISFSALQRHVKNHLPELRSGTAARLPEDLKVERQPDRSFVRRTEARWCEIPGKGCFELAPARADIVTVGPVGLFVAKRECIAPNNHRYLDGDMEIWPLDWELGSYWKPVETDAKLDPSDAGKGKFKKTKRWRTAADDVRPTRSFA